MINLDEIRKRAEEMTKQYKFGVIRMQPTEFEKSAMWAADTILQLCDEVERLNERRNADAEVKKASCCVANEEAVTELTRKIEVARMALALECGNRCNAEYNPCNAREALKEIEK